jgi:hypothetical protein
MREGAINGISQATTRDQVVVEACNPEYNPPKEPESG